MPELSTTSTPSLHRLKKEEVIWLATHRCQHRHTYLEHFSCYTPPKERLGFLDIESSNLDADFGIILSWCILDDNGKTMHYDVITPQDIKKNEAGSEDKRVVQTLIKALDKFDRVVGYYSSKFDVPYIRTRAMVTKVPFPSYGTLRHTDLYYQIKMRFKLSRNRLENACRVLLGKTQKTHIQAKYWRGGVRGDKKSLQYILDHNRKDVIDLRDLYHAVVDFGRNPSTSL